MSVRLPIGVSTPPDPAALEHEARARAATALPDRERAVEIAAGALFVGGAIALLLLGGGTVRGDVLVVLILAFAITNRARFDVGGGFVSPTQLVFVSALLLEPPRVAPCIALAGVVLGRLPNVVGGTMHPTRLALLPGDCLYALGPALVLTVAGIDGAHWGDWPWYVAAIAAQFLVDFAGGAARGGLALGIPLAEQLRTGAYVWSIDGALSPIGLLAAFASAGWRFAFVGVIPLAMLLVVLSQERSRRLETELQAGREREALIAGASHELQTPLAILSGLLDRLAHDPGAPQARRAQSYEAMGRQTAHLRYLVGQFVDYATIKSGQDLPVTLAAVELDPVLGAVAALWRPDVQIEIVPGGAVAMADGSRLQRVVMSLVANAVRHGPPAGPVTLSARRESGAVIVQVADRGPGIPAAARAGVFAEADPRAGAREGIGVGLFLARASLREQGGDIGLRDRPGGGLLVELLLPSAD